MEKKIINPWQWQNDRNYVQGVAVTNPTNILYVAGQAAVHADGISSNAAMRTQLLLAIENLETVIKQAGYECKHIARLTVMNTNSEEFFACFDILQKWIGDNEVKQVTTVFEVPRLFETLKVELEATLVK